MKKGIIMCNRLHGEITPIPETGIGYKVFEWANGRRLRDLSRSVIFNPTERIIWNDEIGNSGLREGGGDGFCYFLDKSECQRLLDRWIVLYYGSQAVFVMKKIKYYGGLGEFMEHHISYEIPPFKICLCKEFEILEDC